VSEPNLILTFALVIETERGTNHRGTEDTEQEHRGQMKTGAIRVRDSGSVTIYLRRAEPCLGIRPRLHGLDREQLLNRDQDFELCESSLEPQFQALQIPNHLD